MHVDYQFRDVDDHDPKTPIGYKTFEQRSLPPISPKEHSGGSGDKSSKTVVNFAET